MPPDPPSPRRPLALAARVTAATAALLAVASWPLLLHPATRTLGHTKGDFATISWGLWRVSQGRWGPAHADVRFPDGGVIVIADLPEALALAPVTWLAGPVVAFNLLQALHVVLAAGAAAWLAAARGATGAGAAAAGLAFGLMPVMTASTFSGNPEVTPFFLVPLAALAASSLGRRTGAAVAAGLLIGLAAWCNPYVALMAGLAALFAAPWSLRPRFLLGGLLLTAIALGLGGAHVVIMAESLSDPSSMLNKELAPVGFPGPGWARGLAWPDLDLGQTGGAVHCWYLGLSVLAAGLGGLLLQPRRGLRWFLLALLGAALAMGQSLHLGPPPGPHTAGIVAMPGAWLSQLPGLSSMRLVFRFAALGSLGLGLLAAVATDRLPRRLRWLVPAVIAGDLLFFAPGWSWLASEPALETRSCALLADLPPGPVVDLPGTRDGRYLLAQTCHGNPIAQGVHQPWADDVRRALLAPVPVVPERLHALGFRWLVLHPGIQGDRDAQIPTLMRTAAARGAIAASDGDLFVIDLGEPAP